MSNYSVSSEELKWYAVCVRHQNEFKISRVFSERLGLAARVPSRALWRVRQGKKATVVKPVLDTYVFVKANMRAMNWALFYSVSGVLGLVRHAGAPAAVPEEQIASLEKLGASAQPVHEMEYRKLAPNEMVEVIAGPLKGAVGHFLKSNTRTGQFVVSVDLFHRSLVTEVDACFVRPC